MKMSGEYRIEAQREEVWRLLNDPEALRQSIPGCEELTKTGDDSFEAKVRAKVGPVSAKFAGTVTLSDINPPESYTISGEGKGGAAGFAKGGAKVRLDADGTTTVLHYEVDAKVGGKLAQLGSRLIEGSAKKMADDFFGRFAELAAGGPSASEEAEMAAKAMAGAAPGHAAPEGATLAAASEPQAETAPRAAKKRLGPVSWVALLVVALAILLALFALN
jgi:carbon monoxide dehydrogenase subunit G